MSFILRLVSLCYMFLQFVIVINLSCKFYKHLKLNYSYQTYISTKMCVISNSISFIKTGTKFLRTFYEDKYIDIWFLYYVCLKKIYFIPKYTLIFVWQLY